MSPTQITGTGDKEILCGTDWSGRNEISDHRITCPLFNTIGSGFAIMRPCPATQVGSGGTLALIPEVESLFFFCSQIMSTHPETNSPMLMS